MKSILIITLISSVLVILASALPTREPAPIFSLKNINQHWTDFVKVHSKRYDNSSDEVKRKSIFAASLRTIIDHNNGYNNGTQTYTLGATRFADWTYEEFQSFVKNGGLNSDVIPKNARMAPIPRQSAPASIDWRNYNGRNYVQAIQNQGSCGSCWAFSAISSIESYAAIATRVLPNLSEQNLIDCVYGRNGCFGGGVPNAYIYHLRNGGIATEASYPNIGTWSGRCRYTASMNSGIRVNGYYIVGGGDAGLTSCLGRYGPITGYIYASSRNFQLYRSGVFSDAECTGRTVDHAINLVGYGSLNGANHYILRNSWGTGWGMGGYMFIARGSNMCSVASYNYFPSVTVSSG